MKKILDIIIAIIDFLGFLFILIAAFTISSKFVVNPKSRLFAFTCYSIACFFLITWGSLVQGWYTWFSLQQIILFFINIRGIINAMRDLKNLEEKKGLYGIDIPSNFWDDILKDFDDEEIEEQ